MRFGMKPNGYKKTIKEIMPNKAFVYWMAGLGMSLFCTFADADEILGHISDDTEPKSAQHSIAEDHTNSDRKIIYRVICSPTDEPLPDCEQPFHDVESDNQPKATEESAEHPEEVDRTKDTEENEKTAEKPSSGLNKSQAKAKETAKKQPTSKKSRQFGKSSSAPKKNTKDLKKTIAKKNIKK